MKKSLITLLLTASFGLFAQEGMPRMYSVDPTSGKTGDVIVVTGDNLTKTCVAKVYLTDGKIDTPVEVVEQTQTTLKFKIPAKLHPGRLAVMVLTVGKDAKYIEQPVKVLIEDSLAPPPTQ